MTTFAVCIGIRRYPNASPIPPAEREAMQVHLRLRARGVESTLLTAARATRDMVVEEIERLAAISRPGDLVIIYFTGHGGRDTHQREADGSAREYLLLTSGALFDNDLDELLGRFAGRRVLLLLDACHAAGMLDSISQLAPHAGWTLGIASSLSGDLSKGDDSGSFMTIALLGALDRADLPATFGELFNDLRDNMNGDPPVLVASNPNALAERFLPNSEVPVVPGDVQAHVLFGTSRQKYATLAFFRIEDVGAFKRSMAHQGAKPTTVAECANDLPCGVALSLTFLGLEALGAPELLHVGQYSLARAYPNGRPGHGPAQPYTTESGVIYYGNPQTYRPSFDAGMVQASSLRLMDPFVGAGAHHTWKVRYTADDPIHGLFVVWGRTEGDVIDRQHELDAAIRGVSWGSVEQAYLRDDRTEHFGFKDGVAKAGVAARLNANAADPRIVPRNATSVDPLSDLLLFADQGFPLPAWSVNGSFLVYRRLRQDVRGFRAASAALALRLGVPQADAEARLVGRMKDGRSLEEDPALTPSPDTAEGDPQALDGFDHRSRRCPVYSHSRKANPRDPNRRTPPLFRRGMSYGAIFQEDEHGSPDRGLHFMCYQSSIEGQFEAVSDWLNGRPPGHGPVDLLLGRGDRDPWPAERSVAGIPAPPCALREFVCATGGEYFFSPTLAGIRLLCE